MCSSFRPVSTVSLGQMDVLDELRRRCIWHARLALLDAISWSCSTACWVCCYKSHCLNNCPSAGRQSTPIDAAGLYDGSDHLHNARKQLAFQLCCPCGSGREKKNCFLLYYFFLTAGGLNCYLNISSVPLFQVSVVADENLSKFVHLRMTCTLPQAARVHLQSTQNTKQLLFHQ